MLTHNTATLALAVLMQGHTQRVMSVGWNTKGTKLASCGCDYTVCLWEVGSWKNYTTLKVRLVLLLQGTW